MRLWSGVAVLLVTACGAGSDSPVGTNPQVAVSPRTTTLPPGGQCAFTAAVSGAGASSILWSVRQGLSGGTVDANGFYTAPPSSGLFQVVATEPSSGATGEAQVTVTTSCWQLLPVNRVRFHPRPGAESAMIGGLIQGSNDSATTAFTTLATISSASAGWNEIVFANTTPYRWVKYVGPSGSFGQVAELEFYSDAARLEGDGFGTAGSRSGNPWQNALDGTTETFFDGPESVDVYVGLDAAAGHVTATPQVSPAGGQVPQIVTLSSATPGATVRYTLDGSDPATGIVYTGPISITSSATVRAIATAPCNVRSAVATQAFTASPATNVSVDVIGNSLTDSVDSGYLQAIAAAGGVNLDYARHTVPGIGTYIYPENGAGVRSYITTNSRDHVTMQPAANMPCLPTGGDPAPGVNASDATNIDLMWDEAVTRNPATRVWVYQTWSAPNAYTNCIAGGAWLRDPRIWNPPAPTSWEAATNNFGAYAEAVRAGIMSLNPTRPTPYVIPGGRALVALKAAVEAGRLPGVAANGFFPFVYSLAYGDDDHLTEQGRYFITLVFYACMFQRDPRALPDTNLGTAATLTAGQAAMLQQVVYEVVSEYPLSGFLR